MSVKLQTKIVLFSPKPSELNFYGGVPIPLLSIVRFLAKDKKYDIKIIKATPKYDYFSTIVEEADGALCVGISSMTGYQIKEGLILSEMIKKKYPNLPIIWGGWHPTILPEETIKDNRVDIVLMGQGERTFPELVKCIEEKSNLNKVDGICFKQNGRIIKTQERKFENLNNFPTLPYDIISDIEDCIKHTELGTRTINYISSLGCPHRCAFCAERIISKRRWYGIEAKRVVDEIENLVKKYNINGIFITDSNFFVDKHRVETICKEIINRGIKVKFGKINGRTEQLVKFKKSLWDLMEKAGFSSILIGAESHSQEILDIIQKDAKVEDTINLAKLCKSHNIELIYSLMIGIPNPKGIEYTKKYIKEDFTKTISFINEIHQNSNKFTILLFVYTPYPGTPMFDLSLKFGVKVPNILENWSKFTLLNKNIPWVPEKYVSLVNQLSISILPYLPNVRKNKKIFATILHYIAVLRMKLHFFAFPIEYKLIRYYIDKSDFKKTKRCM